VSSSKVILKRGRANPVWRGHPWVFSGAVERTTAPYQPGDLVEVCDAEERTIGHGFINPRSQIVVRMLTRAGEPLDSAGPGPGPGPGSDHAAGVADHQGDAQRVLAALIGRRIREAAALRQRLGLPSAETTAYRLVNAEGDGLPGLMIDMFGSVAVVQFTALGMKRNEEAVWQALRALPQPPAAIAEAPAGSFAQVEGFSASGRMIEGDPALIQSGVACRENSVDLTVDVKDGQKTGMFLDQRDNRLLLGRYCGGAKVLDVYSYAGGFALQALRHGASEATCVDISPRALALAEQNAARNHLGPLTTVEADAFRFLESAPPLGYDVVVVDPPKFARAQKDLPAAQKGYQRLNALALNAVRRGGLLASCSCSQLVDEETFERMLAAAAAHAGRRITVVHRGSQGPDHPVPPAFPEGRYLKFVVLGVS
jgi:23S rRNA (cytosine1962-C5)-methyltransferase